VEEIADVKMKRNYILDAPLGVRGRNSDNTLIREYLDWEPSVSLKEGIDRMYGWIYEEVQR
jgi:nucleoside-diphosphate-sugar epimerase